MLEDEQELDILGIKTNSEGGECLVIETKGQSTTDRELEEEVKYFPSKVETLKEHLPELAKEIGYEGDLNSITGIFVSMARLGRFDHGESDVALWDFEDFISELRAEHFLSASWIYLKRPQSPENGRQGISWIQLGLIPMTGMKVYPKLRTS